jgi:hypothetical protein
MNLGAVTGTDMVLKQSLKKCDNVSVHVNHNADKVKISLCKLPPVERYTHSLTYGHWLMSCAARM